MARRKKPQEPINHERWLVSYADFITLLFAFFVVMYAISSINEGKFRILSDTLETVFTSPDKTLEPVQLGELVREQDPSPGQKRTKEKNIEIIQLPIQPEVDKETIRTINDISNQLNQALEEQIQNEDITIKKGEDWLELEMKSNILFLSGESRLEEEAMPILSKVANILNQSGNPILVEGFTDNQPIETPRFPSNWELSAARAASVANILDRFGLIPTRLSAIGYGQFRPIADNRTESGRQKNRRVVLVVLGNDKNSRSPDTYYQRRNQSGASATPTL